MARILIVAEKPAQAREYAAALNVNKKGQGYLENDQYIITWCVGHLLELEKPEAYMDLDRVGRRWSLQRLPVLPGIGDFRHQVKAGTSKQYQVLQKLLQANEVSTVICGTDADREGQLLFQEVWDKVGCNKPLLRLWISSLTKEAIREGMSNLLDASDVRGLASASYGRAYADWDFGMNLTEGFTALFGSFDTLRKKPNVISIGRVQTPTLALIVKREWEIEQFVPEEYFDVVALFAGEQGEYSGHWFDPESENKRLTDRQKAEHIVNKTLGQIGNVAKTNRKKFSEPPPLLFDLTGLTVAASKKHGYSAEKVLELAQSLYEKKAITYPRTDCVYLSKDMIPKLKNHLMALQHEPYLEYVDEASGYGVPTGKRIINTITAHHAIIPTTEKIDPRKLSDPERHIYDLIARRFLAVWFPPAEFEQTEIITVTTGEYFQTKGKTLLSPGWKKVYDSEEKNDEKDEVQSLPQLAQGDNVLTKEVRCEEKSTKPPKRYTQGDLLKAMEAAGKQIEDDLLRQQMKGKGIGTVATRPAIIENLIQRGYISQEQKTLRPTDKGTQLISLIQDRLKEASLLISPEMTGQMEYHLAQVEKGKLALASYMREVEEAVVRIINELRSYERKHGKTPLALAPIKSDKRKKSTEKKSKQVSVKDKRKVREKDVGRGKVTSQGEKQQISTGTQNEVRPDIEKAGQKERKHSDTKNIEIHNEKNNVDRDNQAKDSLGMCPSCGSEIIEGHKGYGCSNWKSGCRFVVWKTPICGKVLTRTQIKSLLKKGKTPLIKGFVSQSGKPFTASLIWSDAANGKLKFDFGNN
ncbi:DNA topoisomerase 3 [Dehalobacter sp. DCM]|uniref:type IA DNA topoisomerase n=1 Tax=Dehalobacter sp. DCM TaxID=2907827 RepID=UPI00308158D6|nr:DNA topoisomerase 3 [Dehalobacter sp. DCM]